MRIVFIGTVDFSSHCLKEVLKNGGNVVAVFTLLQRKAGFHSDYVDISNIAEQHGIPVYKIQNINTPDNVELIRSLQPDVIFVFGWSQLISKEIIDIPPLGCIGSHPALLPQNRGRHPLIWALVDGLTESGLTFFYIDEGADSGDILWQKPFSITLKDDAGSLYEKIKVLASEAIREFMPQLEQKIAPRIPQDHSKATYRPKRTEKDGEIDWTMPTIKIYNLIRALTHPYVGAHTYLANTKIKIWRSSLPSQPLAKDLIKTLPGTIIAKTGKSFSVKTGDNYINILEWEAHNSTDISVDKRFESYDPGQ